MSSASEPVPATSSTSSVNIADPAPLGLAGFGITTLVLSCFNAGFLNNSAEAVVLPLALFYGGLGQLLAGMWEFRKGNTFGATAFTSFGAFWLSYYLLAKDILPSLTGSTASNTGNAVGLFLLAWGIFTLYMTVAALRQSRAVLAIFVALTATFVVLAIGAFEANTTVTKVGGWLGLVTAAVALYTSFAGVTAATYGRPVLPTFPPK
ncbi:acetate uptake transporter [Streptacidiphilus albus]|uniref:acetate uptake transporter n=1 Tax=Streptacidiphilus albus TaxID=105425 RepID=UPI00054B143A|nr:GPR1/FUN34/YaaH family transporter [Streptacidiphilus albus]